MKAITPDILSSAYKTTTHRIELEEIQLDDDDMEWKHK